MISNNYVFIFNCDFKDGIKDLGKGRGEFIIFVFINFCII